MTAVRFAAFHEFKASLTNARPHHSAQACMDAGHALLNHGRLDFKMDALEKSEFIIVVKKLFLNEIQILGFKGTLNLRQKRIL